MKKNLRQLIALTVLIFLIITNKVKAQDEKPFIFGAEVYYGFPNIFTDIIVDTYENEYDLTNYSLHILGPTGMRVEFYVDKHIAFGVDVNYSVTELSWTHANLIYDPFTGTFTKGKEYHYRVDAPRLRILPKFTAHFASNKYFDGYVSAGIGYNNTQITLTTDEPGKDYHQETRFPLAYMPICMRFSMGGKYYFLKNLGVGFEVGLGGPLLSCSLSSRF